MTAREGSLAERAARGLVKSEARDDYGPCLAREKGVLSSNGFRLRADAAAGLGPEDGLAAHSSIFFVSHSAHNVGCWRRSAHPASLADIRS